MAPYFKQYHYDTFTPPKPELDDDNVRRERMEVARALLDIGDALWPFIQVKGWDLHRHRQKQHYTSSDHFIFAPDGQPIVKHIGSMWLHYGKSPKQLDSLRALGGYDYRDKDVEEYYNAFYLHTRIQVYISRHVVRCWLLLATDKNYYDRSEFKKRLARDPGFKDRFWNEIGNICDQGFFYEIDDDRMDLVSGMDRDEFFRFVFRDKGGVYSGIAREYLPEDPRIDGFTNIVEEMKEGFEKLYPLYDMMAYRMIAPKPQKTAPDLSGLFGGVARVRKA